ncbi:toll-like receptor 13 isoform X2 [Gouania willdenowi]|uniref:toll-like receptor 13 isoform X2 n=1 Tax=Gouania willdenowi TaxID=441366 RepID=UPI001054E478|nr:toll-like receptor 13 isoform X2 [Gouania willdenowi]
MLMKKHLLQLYSTLLESPNQHSMVTMPERRSCSQLLVSLLCFVLVLDSTLSFSLKNCSYSSSEEDAEYIMVECERHGLTVVPPDIPQNATTLSVAVNSIVQINRTDLQGLSRLKSLRCDFNLISHIESGAFTDLGNLIIIVLNNNKLTYLVDNMFLGLSKLEDLSLSSNQISLISPLAFQSLNSIKSIHLGLNNLHQVADIIPVLSNPTLKTLVLFHNNFSSFQTDDLPESASNLTSLMIGLNPLKKFNITKDVFPHLKELNLDGCTKDLVWAVGNKKFLQALTDLTIGGSYITFDTYTAMIQASGSLKRLELYNMNLVLVADVVEIACRIPSLQTLLLTEAELGTVDDKLLCACSKLTELKLPNDQLTNMSDHSLQSMTQLRILWLNNNHFSKLPVTIRELSLLEILDLSYNFLSKLDCLDFHDLKKMKSINLNSNRISSLQECLFETLLDLENLDIGNNSVFSVGDSFKVNLGKLELLNLQNNQLDVIYPGTFRNLSSLHKLNIESWQNYVVFHGAFEGLDNLQSLTLTLFEFTEELFMGLPQLKTLSLLMPVNVNHKISMQINTKPFTDLPHLKKLTVVIDGSHQLDISPDLLSGLRSLEILLAENFFKASVHLDTFRFTPKLKNLQIVHSDLSDLTPELFWYIPDLKELDLSNNKLKSLDFLAQAKLLALSVLKLSNNDLSVINETVFQFLPALRYLDLSDNPLTCECSNSGFMQWIQTNNQTQVVNGYQYICAFPVRLQGEHFLDFDVHSCWMDESFLCFISSTCLIMFVLLTSFIYHFLRWHLTYAYYLFVAFLYDNSRKKAGTPHRYDAFISYNVHDEAWVYRELLPVLEGQQGWTLCLHHRDFEPGYCGKHHRRHLQQQEDPLCDQPPLPAKRVVLQRDPNCQLSAVRRAQGCADHAVPGRHPGQAALSVLQNEASGEEVHLSELATGWPARWGLLGESTESAEDARRS